MNELEIINGTMGIPFDPLVTYYTVTVSDDVQELLINYEVNEGSIVNVINNNNLVEGVNFVYLEVKNNEMTETYTLEVYKENVKTVIKEENVNVDLGVAAEVNPGVYYLLFLVCFLLILLTYKLVYKKPKRVKKSKI